MVIANGVMFKAAQPLGPMLAGRVLCRSATRQPGVEGRGSTVQARVFWSRFCRCAALAPLQTHSASSAQQNTATPNKEEKINHNPNEQEKNNK